MSDKASATTPKAATSPMYWVHTVICLVIMFGFGELPPLAP